MFVVRKGNPKQIKDWPDLVQGDVEIITPIPNSGNGKLSFLAAWGSVVRRGGSEDDAQQFVTRALSTRAGARLGRPRGDDHLCPERESATCT